LTESNLVRSLSEADCPDGTLICVFNDSHCGIMDGSAASLMVECAEKEGASFIIGNGDVADCASVSPHELKQKKAVYNYGALEGELKRDRWLIDWMATRPGKALLGTGNHEDWINDLALRNGLTGTLTVRSALQVPACVEVLPHGYQIKLGSLVIEHGDLIFPRGMGGVNLARSILLKYPSQTTIAGHFHRQQSALRTEVDHSGSFRSFGAFPLGHLSLPREHREYAGRDPDWQQGFGLIRVWYDGKSPRFTIHQIEIHRDRYNKPIFEFNGHLYR
jgi:hypothetical protein